MWNPVTLSIQKMLKNHECIYAIRALHKFANKKMSHAIVRGKFISTQNRLGGTFYNRYREINASEHGTVAT